MPDAAARLQAIRSAIADAAKMARREPSTITLVAVSKNRSPEEIEGLIAAGQRHFGENRVQEAASKWPALRKRYPDVVLHMIGRLQSNKAEEAVALFDVIHSLDRSSLAAALAKAEWSRPTYVQVNIGEEPQKGGVALAELPGFLAGVRTGGLTLAGLMAIPPADVEPSPYFALLAKLARRHDVSGLSMGMSGDFRSAVMLGATVVRVGTALFED
jgi:pyridoxal phosphate enzyme (YggS family)